jgi:hypothetical protein
MNFVNLSTDVSVRLELELNENRNTVHTHYPQEERSDSQLVEVPKSDS